MKKHLGYFKYTITLCGLLVFLFAAVSCEGPELKPGPDDSEEKEKENKESLQICITEDYLEEYTSMLVSDGRFLLMKPDRVGTFFLMYDSMTNDRKVVEDLGVCIYCDSLMRPSIMQTANEMLLFSHYTSDSFDLTILTDKSQQTYSDIAFTSFTTQHINASDSTGAGEVLNTAGRVLAIASAGAAYIQGGLDELSESLLRTIAEPAVDGISERLGDLTGTRLAVFSGYATGISTWAISTLQAMRETAHYKIRQMKIKSLAQEWENHDTDSVQFQMQVVVVYPSEDDAAAKQNNSDYGICVNQEGTKVYYSSIENPEAGSVKKYTIPIIANKSDFRLNESTYFIEYCGPEITMQTYYNYSGTLVYGEPYDVKLSYTEPHGCPDGNHPHAINMGLPSGTKWCCCNVDASTPEDYGGYYAWGETEEKSVYTERTYKYSSGTDTGGDGWYDINRSYQNIGSEIAGTSYDVARAKMGGSWQIPSWTQMSELLGNSTEEKAIWNGVNGYLITGPNGGQIFLPAAGLRSGEELGAEGLHGFYWTGTLCPDVDIDDYGDDKAYRLYFIPRYMYWDVNFRYLGQPVRAVCP